jgi:hypothetical protein
LKMDPIEGSETSANINQTLGIHPKIETVNSLLVIIFVYFSLRIKPVDQLKEQLLKDNPLYQL